MAEGVPDGLREVAEIALRSAEQGRRVRIVTDHGWLLMPGGFQQAALETGLVEPSGKRSRMAALKLGAPTSYLRVPWTWDSSVSLVVPTGARTLLPSRRETFSSGLRLCHTEGVKNPFVAHAIFRATALPKHRHFTGIS